MIICELIVPLIPEDPSKHDGSERPPVELLDHRTFRQSHCEYCRSDRSAETARQAVASAVTSANPTIRTAGLSFLLDLRTDLSAPAALLENYDVTAGGPRTRGRRPSEGQLLLETLRADPPGITSLLEELATVIRHNPQTTVVDSVCAVAGRDPALLKPIISTLAAQMDEEEQIQWLMTRLASVEEALVRRYAANAVWTIEQGLEEGNPVPTAVRTLTNIEAILPDDVAPSVDYEQLLTHLDEETRRRATNGIAKLATQARQSGLERIDIDTIGSHLIDGVHAADRAQRNAAAQALGAVAVLDDATAVAGLNALTRSITAHTQTGLRTKVAAIETVVSATPSLRERATVARLAALLESGFDPEEVVQLLTTIEVHGQVATEAIDLAVIAVHLGHESDRVREQAVDTLLSIGMASPDHRTEIVQWLRWARHDETADVQVRALQALGTAGQLWPATTPQVTASLLEHLSQYPGNAEAVANALVDVNDTFLRAIPAISEQLRQSTGKSGISRATASCCLRVFVTKSPRELTDSLEALAEWAGHPSDEGGRDAAEALLSVAREVPDRVAEVSDQILAVLETDRVEPAQWAALAAAYSLAEYRATDGAPPVEWLRKRFSEAPLAFGAALAAITEDHPEIALPPIESIVATIRRTPESDEVLETEAATERILGRLVGSHPAVGSAVVRTLYTMLERPEARDAAAPVLEEALTEWPYLTPLAADSMVNCLDVAGPRTLAHLAAPLSQLESAAARTALDQLADHPNTAIRHAAERARSEHNDSDRTPSPQFIFEIDVANVSTADVDRVARGLATHSDDYAAVALDGLQRIAGERPDLRTRSISHVLGYITAADQPDPTTPEIISCISPDVAAVAIPETQSGDDIDLQLLAELLGLFTDSENDLVRGQAVTAIQAVVRRNPEFASTTVLNHLEAGVEVDAQFVQARSLQAIGELADLLPVDSIEATETLEPRLFKPHSVVPQATFAVGELAKEAPNTVVPVAESLTGLLDWTPLDRQHARVTIRDVIAAAPECEMLFAERMLDQLATEDEVPNSVLEIVGQLSGEVIAATDGGTKTLLAYLRETESGYGYGIVADRLLRVAESAPAAVRGALDDEDENTLPPIRRGGLLHYLRALEIGLTEGDKRLDYPLIDIGNVFDPATDVTRAQNAVDSVDRGVTRIGLEDTSETGRQAKSILISILTELGHAEFLRVLEPYQTSGPVVTPRPEQVTTWFRRSADADLRERAAKTICEHASPEYTKDVAAEMAATIGEGPRNRQQRVLAVLPQFTAAISTDSARREIWVTIEEALTDEWEIQLTALDAVVSLGQLADFPSAPAIELLTDQLGCPAPTVRRRAAEGIATVCLESIVDIEPIVDDLREAVTSDKSSLERRRGSTIALGLIAAGEPGLRERVLETLNSTLSADDPKLRQHGVEAFQAVSETEAAAVSDRIGCIAERIGDIELSVQRSAIECLATIGRTQRFRQRVSRALAVSLDVERSRIRATCAETLSEILSMHVSLEAALVERIRSRVDDPNPAVRAAAIRSLSYVGTDADLRRITARKSDPHPDVRAAATEAKRRIERALSQEQLPPQVRSAGVPTNKYNHARTAVQRGAQPDPGATRSWSFDIREQIHASPAVVDGTVFIAGEYHIWALSAATGEKRWQYRRGDEFEPGLNQLFGDGGSHTARSSPTVSDGSLYIGHIRSESAEVYALDAGTGTENWTLETDCPVNTTPSVIDETVLLGTGDGELLARTTSDGSERWTFETATSNCSTPATNGETVFVMSGGSHVHAIDPTDGGEQWATELESDSQQIRSPPAVLQDTVYVFPLNAGIVALDSSNGAVRWRTELEDSNNVFTAVTAPRVFAGTDTGVLHSIDTTDGSEEWRVTFDDSPLFPAVVGETVVVGTASGTLYGVRESDGEELWRVQTYSPIDALPVVIDGSIYVTTATGKVVAIE